MVGTKPTVAAAARWASRPRRTRRWCRGPRSASAMAPDPYRSAGSPSPSTSRGAEVTAPAPGSAFVSDGSMAARCRDTVAQSPAHHRPRERLPGPQLGHVVERAPGQVEVGPAGHADARSDALHLAHERHQVVGGDHGGGVVGGPVLVGHREPATAQIGHQPLHDRVARHGEPGARRQALGPQGSRGQRHQRVHRPHPAGRRARPVRGCPSSAPPRRWGRVPPPRRWHPPTASGVAISTRSTPAAAPDGWSPRRTGSATSQPTRPNARAKAPPTPTGADHPQPRRHGHVGPGHPRRG